MQLTILWGTLKRFPPIEVVEKPKRAYSNLIHGITEMKVRIPALGQALPHQQGGAYVHVCAGRGPPITCAAHQDDARHASRFENL